MERVHDWGAPLEYRKKPVVVEAMCWNNGNEYSIVEWIRSEGGNAHFERIPVSTSRFNTRFEDKILILTEEGWISASPGDYVIRGVQGEFYPCKPQIFADTYNLEVSE